MQEKKYLILLSLGISFVLSGIAIVNYIVDPYGIYNALIIKDFNDRKPLINSHTRLHKSQKVFMNQYDCIFLGTSRVEASMDFYKGDDIYQFCKNYYNFALSAASIKEISYLLPMVLKYAKPSKIFYGLDFLQFRYKSFQDVPIDTLYYKKPLLIRYALLLSYDVLMDSRKTIFSREKSYYKDNGAWDLQANYLKKFPPQFDLYTIFLINEKYYYDSAYENIMISRDHINAFTDFINILDTMYQQNHIDMYLYINPFHVRLLEILDAKIGYHFFELWKKQLVFINEKIARKYHKNPFVLYDFSGYNIVTTEPLKKHVKELNYFYESSHPKRIIGKIIIKKIFHLETEKKFKDFGIILSSKNIEEYLQKERIKRKKWQQEHHFEIKEMLNFVRQKLSIPEL